MGGLVSMLSLMEPTRAAKDCHFVFYVQVWSASIYQVLCCVNLGGSCWEDKIIPTVKGFLA